MSFDEDLFVYISEPPNGALMRKRGGRELEGNGLSTPHLMDSPPTLAGCD